MSEDRRQARAPAGNPPLGLILCAEKNAEEIELLELHHGSIRVAEYLTELPPRDVLERKLHAAITLARSRSTKAIADERDDDKSR